jgi:hypothetical protein
MCLGLYSGVLRRMMQKDLVDERRKTSEQAYLETNEFKSRNGGFVEGCSVTKQSQSS